jgi:hypothetical protein
MPSPALTFGVVDGDPSVWGPGEAWVFSSGAWARGHSSEIGMDGRVLSKAAFDAKFPSLPPLPSNAFHSGPSNTAP